MILENNSIISYSNDAISYRDVVTFKDSVIAYHIPIRSIEFMCYSNQKLDIHLKSGAVIFIPCLKESEYKIILSWLEV